MELPKGLQVEAELKRLSINEQKRIQKMNGGTPFVKLYSDFGALSAEAIQALLFVVMRRDHPELTLEDIENLPGALGAFDNDEEEDGEVPLDESES